MLIKEGHDTSIVREAMAEGLRKVAGKHLQYCKLISLFAVVLKFVLFFADAMEVSSLHMTFNSDVEHSTLESQGFISRLGMQYHWKNNGYETFNDFLLDLRQSKRKTVKQVAQNNEGSIVSEKSCCT